MAALIDRRLVLRSLGLLTGLCAGIAAGLLVTDGDPVGLASLTVGVGAALGLAVLVVQRAAWRDVLPLVVFATMLRAATAVALYDALLAAGRGGFVTGDDAGYFDLATRLARILHDDPAPFDYGAEGYLLGTFVYLETLIFYLVGPKVIVVELLNAAMGGMLVAFVHDIARRIFANLRAGLIAATLVAVYPSLVLWSALNLKDSLALVLIALVLWLLVLFNSYPRWWLVPAAFVPLLLIENLRNYIFFGLAIVIPASIALAPGPSPRLRVATSALAFGLSAFLIGAHLTGVGAPLPSGLAGLEIQRAAMGVGANTSFADSPPLEVEQGATYVIPGTSPPSASPRVLVVAPGTSIVLATGATDATPVDDVVAVHSGDLIVIGSPGETPTLPEHWKPLSIPHGSNAVELVSTDDNGPLLRTLRYLPIGVTYVLFAPFPWSIRRTLDVLTVPEMLIWYLVLLAAVVAVARYRRAWRSLAPLVLFVCGTVLILALAEGNVGTLFRHRAMVIPFVVVLASAGLAMAFGAATQVRSLRGAADGASTSAPFSQRSARRGTH